MKKRTSYRVAAQAAALLLATCGAASATTDKISLNIKGEPLSRVLALLPGTYSIETSAIASQKVYVATNESDLEDALTKTLSPNGLTYTRQGQQFAIVKQPRVSLSVANQPFYAIAPLVFGGTPWLIADGAVHDFMVNANLTDVPLDQAVSAIVRQAGYQWRRENGAYLIYRDKEATLRLSFPSMGQNFSVGSTRSGGQNSANGGSGSQGAASTASTPSTSSTSSTGTGAGTTGGSSSSQATSTGTTATIDGVQAAIKEMLSKDGKLAVHKEMGVVWVRDRADIVDRVTNYVDEMNASLTRAVKISGIITEVTLNDAKDIGVDWEFVVKDVLTATTSVANLVTTPAMLLDFNWDNKKEKAYVAALQQFGDVKIVSRPSISVANGAVGSLTVGDTISYIYQTTNTPATATTNGATGITPRDMQIGLSFYVVPRIINDREAVIYISPDMTTLTEIRTIVNDSGTIELPRISQKQTQTVITVKNGEKILLSGMISDSNKKQRTGVPILMDVPYLGKLFSHERTDTQRTEFALMVEVKW